MSMRRRFLAAAINGIKCFLYGFAVLVINKTADMVAAVAAILPGIKTMKLDKTAGIDAYPVEDLDIEREIATAKEVDLDAIDTTLAASDRTVYLVAIRGLEGWIRAELKYIYTLFFSRVAGLLSAVGGVLRRSEVYKFILTAAAGAYNAVLMSRSATIEIGKAADAVSGDASLTSAERSVTFDLTAGCVPADAVQPDISPAMQYVVSTPFELPSGALANTKRKIAVGCLAELYSLVFASVDRTIITKAVANLTAREDSWIYPEESGIDLYICSSCYAAELGDDLYLGKAFRAPMESGEDLYITSVYATVDRDSDLYIGPAFFAPEELGSDLYIKSVYSAVLKGEDLYLGGTVFHAPVETGDELYIQSVYHVIAAGSDLYITNKEE